MITSIHDIANRVTITPDEFTQISGMGRTKTFDLIREGRLEVERIGRKTLISVESAISLIAPRSKRLYLHQTSSCDEGA